MLTFLLWETLQLIFQDKTFYNFVCTDCRSVLGRTSGRRREGLVHVAVLPFAQGLQAGQVVEISQRHPGVKSIKYLSFNAVEVAGSVRVFVTGKSFQHGLIVQEDRRVVVAPERCSTWADSGLTS